MLHIFNYSVKKLSNLEWSFLIIDSSWKNKTSIISTRTFRMVINLSKNCLQTQSFFIVWNKKQMIFLVVKTGCRERKLLNFKRSSKTFTEDTKPISMSSVSIQPFYTNWLAPTGNFGLQWICWVHLFIETILLHCCLPSNYVTSLLAYCRG